MPTVPWPKLLTASAVRVNGMDDLNSIAIEDIAAEAGHWGYADRHAAREARELIAMVLEAAGADTAPSHIRRLVRIGAKLLLGR